MSLRKLSQAMSSGIKFSNTDSLIYEAIMHNAKSIHQMSATNVANIVPCNHSSVSRFIKKNGFESWAGFVNSIIFEQHIESKVSIDSFQEKINLEIINSQKTISKLEVQKSMEEIIDLLLDEENTFIFYGHRMAGNIAQYLTWNFTASGLFATHTYFLEEFFGLLHPKSTVFILSSPEGAEECTRAAQRARQMGVKVISINIDSNQKIEDLSHINISVPSLNYFEEYEYKSLLKKELMRHVGMVIWEKWVEKKRK
ncbi:MAG: MurR/RpiR family transcriptional regulator [Mycoplasmatales bacterium]|nr:MurR/RpiR family transcriptional regulator [Mycoplasmatales bacterium]